MIGAIKLKLISLSNDKMFSEVLTGSVWALTAKMTAAVLTVFISMIVARVYGAESLGILAVVQSFLTITTIFTVLGTNTCILRLIPEHLAKYSVTSAFRVYRKTQYLVLVVALLTGTLLFLSSGIVAVKIFSIPNLAGFLALTALFVVFKSLGDLNTQAVRGLSLIRVFAFMLILPPVGTLAILLIATFISKAQGNPVYSHLGSWALTAVIGILVMDRVFKKKMRANDRVHSVSYSSIFALSTPMLMTASMQFFIAQTGVIILAMFRTAPEVGYYDIAAKLATLTTFVLSSINSITGPKFSQLFHTNKLEDLFRLAERSARLIFWTTTPILLGLLLLSRPILVRFLGSEYATAYPPLVLLVLGQFVNSASGATALFMNMTGNQKTFRNIIAAAAVMNIGLNLLFIPHFGIVGAAIAATISISFWNIATLLYMKSRYGRTTGYFPAISFQADKRPR